MCGKLANIANVVEHISSMNHFLKAEPKHTVNTSDAYNWNLRAAQHESNDKKTTTTAAAATAASANYYESTQAKRITSRKEEQKPVR